MTSAKQTLYEVVSAHLRNAHPLWGVRVQPLIATSAQIVRPYVVFFEAANSRRLSTPHRKMVEITLSVKGVADNMADALTMEDAISVLLDDSGEQDTDPRLPHHADWHLLTVTETRSLWIEEKFSGAADIYHAGHQYLFVMERR